MHVRFFHRKKRGKILSDRLHHKSKALEVEEDSTNPKCKKCLRKRGDILQGCQSGTRSGKIVANVKNGRSVRLSVHVDLGETVGHVMSATEMVADENIC